MLFEIRKRRNFDNGFSSYILGGDVGGTNLSFGLFGVKKSGLRLIVSFHCKSSQVKNFEASINAILKLIKKEYGISITKACLAVAGPLSPNKDFVSMINLKLVVSKKNLLKKTKLKKIELLNDFQAVGYGINALKPKDLVVVRKGMRIQKGAVLVIGAGTGLGKTSLIFDENLKSYFPHPSEAGHTDFPSQTDDDLKLVEFIKKRINSKENIGYEQVLSGSGLENIYMFLKSKKTFRPSAHTRQIDNSKTKPELISKYRQKDKTCKETFELFARFYAVFARNCALDCLPTGGIYIAGGIGAKNREIFNSEFLKTFNQFYMAYKMFTKIPIYLVINPDIGLLGAGFAGKDL